MRLFSVCNTGSTSRRSNISASAAARSSENRGGAIPDSASTRLPLRHSSCFLTCVGSSAGGSTSARGDSAPFLRAITRCPSGEPIVRISRSAPALFLASAGSANASEVNTNVFSEPGKAISP
jgi:hypothetical protein